MWFFCPLATLNSNSSCYQANSKANGALALGLGDAANDIRLLQFGSAGRAITEQFGILAMEMLDVYVGVSVPCLFTNSLPF